MTLDGLITHEFALEEINEGLDLFRSGEAGRITINLIKTGKAWEMSRDNSKDFLLQLDKEIKSQSFTMGRIRLIWHF